MSPQALGLTPLMTSEPSTYEDQFPPHQRPPGIRNYGGRKALDAREPLYTLELDAGAFRAVWELLESEAKYRFPAKATLSAARAYLRAVDAFRSVYWAHNEPVVIPPPNGKPRRIRKSR